MRKGSARRRENKLYKYIFFTLVLIFVISSSIIIYWLFQTRKTNNISKDIIADVTIPINSNEKANAENITIDFNKLLELNNQVVGWIKINNTTINYPILKTNNNDYYLTHNILNENSTNGWIFMDYRNKSDFSDKNTVIYGHNIKSGIMFSDLKKVYNKKLKEDIYIYTTDGKINKYKIYSCYMCEPDSIPINPYINNGNYDEFVNNMKQRSNYDYGFDVVNGKTITLSTCDSTGKSRIIVHAFN